MLLGSDVLIHRSPEDVWAFLADISNLPKWDRGVAGARRLSANSGGADFEFETIAKPSHADDGDAPGRMAYRVAGSDAPNSCVVRLTSATGNARFFKRAEWRFRAEPAPKGTRLFCCVAFSLKFRYVLLAPVLYLMQGAIRSDLKNLKRVLENEGGDGR